MVLVGADECSEVRYEADMMNVTKAVTSWSIFKESHATQCTQVIPDWESLFQGMVKLYSLETHIVFLGYGKHALQVGR